VRFLGINKVEVKVFSLLIIYNQFQMDNEMNKIRKASEWPSKNATRSFASNMNLTSTQISSSKEARALSLNTSNSPSEEYNPTFFKKVINININCLKNIKITTKLKNKNSFL
jgi:spore coat protein U-like protein